MTRSRRMLAGILPLAGLLALVFTAAATRPGSAATGDTNQQAVQKGVNFLTHDTIEWVKANGCGACHRAGGSLFGLSTARANGYNVKLDDAGGIGYLAKFLADEQQPDGHWSHPPFDISKTSWAMLGLAGYDANISDRFTANLKRGADWALTMQQPDGHWDNDHIAPPTNAGPLDATARFIVSFQQARLRSIGSAKEQEYRQAIDRAVAWMRAQDRDAIARDYGNYGLAWMLIAFAAAEVPNTDADLVNVRDRLLAATSVPTEKAWGRTAEDGADPFNTGMALYAFCQIGFELRDSEEIADALGWLNEQQINDEATQGGYWFGGGFGTVDIPTTFALLGLGCYGDLGVKVRVTGDREFIFGSHQGGEQSHTFTFEVTNDSAFDRADTYDLMVEGGFPGWTGTINPTGPVTLDPGESAVVELTVTIPADQPISLTVPWSLRATSRTNAGITQTATIITRTDPPPPSEGNHTRTILASGDGASVTIGRERIFISAFVYDPMTGDLVIGPEMGSMTFYVAGASIGADDDRDGDGLFSVEWTPPQSSVPGEYALRAFYSGIDFLGDETDLLESEDNGSIKLVAPEAGGDFIVLCVDPDEGRRNSRGLAVQVKGSGFVPGSTASFGPGITVNVGEITNHVLAAQLDIALDAELGLRTVTVTLPDGSSSTMEGAFMVLPALAPELESATPNKGEQGQSLSITLHGHHFLQGATVDLGAGITTSNPVVSSAKRGKPGAQADHLLTFDAAIDLSAAPGARDITVTNPDGQSVTLARGFTVLEQPAPTVKSVAPASGEQGANLTGVRIAGSGFRTGAKVAFGGTGSKIKVTNVVVDSDTVITLDLQIGGGATPGPVDVKVTNPSGKSGTKARAFNVIKAPPIVIEAIDPNTGQPGQEIDVTITGSGFKAGATVMFGDGSVVTVTSAEVKGEGTQIDLNLSIAETAPLGKLDVKVTNPSGRTKTAKAAFEIVEPGPQMYVYPNSLSFRAKVGTTSAAKTLRVENRGLLPLTGRVRPPSKSPFKVKPPTGGALSFTLQPGEVAIYTVTFKPTAVATVNDEIVVTGNDPRNKRVTVDVQGKGTR